MNRQELETAELVELAITRLEYLKEWDAVEEIRDALG